MHCCCNRVTSKLICSWFILQLPCSSISLGHDNEKDEDRVNNIERKSATTAPIANNKISLDRSTDCLNSFARLIYPIVYV